MRKVLKKKKEKNEGEERKRGEKKGKEERGGEEKERRKRRGKKRKKREREKKTLREGGEMTLIQGILDHGCRKKLGGKGREKVRGGRGRGRGRMRGWEKNHSKKLIFLRFCHPEGGR